MSALSFRSRYLLTTSCQKYSVIPFSSEANPMNSLPLVVLIFAFIFIRLAEAHAFLDHADPKVGSTIHDPPTEVTVWMTKNLEAAFSRLQVLDIKGVEVDRKDTRVSGA